MAEFTPWRKTLVSIKRWLGERQGQSGRFEDEKICLILPAIEKRTVSPIAYTDYDIQNNTLRKLNINCLQRYVAKIHTYVKPDTGMLYINIFALYSYVIYSVFRSLSCHRAMKYVV